MLYSPHCAKLRFFNGDCTAYKQCKLPGAVRVFCFFGGFFAHELARIFLMGFGGLSTARISSHYQPVVHCIAHT